MNTLTNFELYQEDLAVLDINEKMDFFYTANIILTVKRNSMGHLTGYLTFLPTEYLNDDTLYTLGVHGGIAKIERAKHFITIGFDCLHFTDYVPQTLEGIGKTYRNVAFVLNELNQLLNEITENNWINFKSETQDIDELENLLSSL